MRLFVALEIPAALRENLARVRRNMQEKLPAASTEMKWVRPENYHVTLKFIGQVSGEELAAINEELRGVRPDGAVKANLRGLGFSWNQKRGGVFWATMQPSDFLKMLARQIDRRLARLGIAAEERDFLPHLTLARFKRSSALAAIRATVAENADTDFGSLQWEKYDLIESKLGRGGSQYSTVASFRFAMAANS